MMEFKIMNKIVLENVVSVMDFVQQLERVLVKLVNEFVISGIILDVNSVMLKLDLILWSVGKYIFFCFIGIVFYGNNFICGE